MVLICLLDLPMDVHENANDSKTGSSLFRVEEPRLDQYLDPMLVAGSPIGV